eukprot:12166317-Alexandrium_andersonii.AAC.1
MGMWRPNPDHTTRQAAATNTTQPGTAGLGRGTLRGMATSNHAQGLPGAPKAGTTTLATWRR